MKLRYRLRKPIMATFFIGGTVALSFLVCDWIGPSAQALVLCIGGYLLTAAAT